MAQATEKGRAEAAKKAAPSGRAKPDTTQDQAGSSLEGDKDPEGTPTDERRTNEIVREHVEGQERGDVAPEEQTQLLAAQPGTPASTTLGPFVRQPRSEGETPEAVEGEALGSGDYEVRDGTVTFTTDVWQKVPIAKSDQFTHVLRFNAGSRFPEDKARQLGII